MVNVSYQVKPGQFIKVGSTIIQVREVSSNGMRLSVPLEQARHKPIVILNTANDAPPVDFNTKR